PEGRGSLGGNVEQIVQVQSPNASESFDQHSSPAHSDFGLGLVLVTGGSMRTMMIAAALLSLAPIAQAQSQADKIANARDGEVRLQFGAREGICGDGRTYIRDRDRDGMISMNDYGTSWRGKGWRDRPCEDGPVRIAIRLSDGSIRAARAYVGGDWSYQRQPSEAVRDPGQVSARAAARALLELARRPELGRTHDLIFPATLADSVVVWRDLLALAKDQRAPRESRKQGVFWLSQAAGDKAAQGLSDMVDDDSEDREIREQAVFALSQLPRDQGVPILIKAARTNKDPKVRRQALFWLGQSDDPRALALFEEILVDRR